MLEQKNNSIKFLAFYSRDNGTGLEGLSVTVDVYSPENIKIISGANALPMGEGLYSYTLNQASVTLKGEYLAIFKTDSIHATQMHIPSLWVVGRAGVENLDVPISSRLAGSAIPDDEETPQKEWTYTLTYPDGLRPITGANIWISKDPTGQQIMASALTNHEGKVRFILPVGEIFVWRRKSGFRFGNPDKEVVA